MSDLDGVSALVAWGISIPLQVWAGFFGGPTIVYAAGLVTFVIGLVLFAAWATAGGIPPMYRH
jgi:tetrahydromethanopterin S-methyltransferase subunit E